VRELAHERSGDCGLARDVATFHDHDPARDRAVIKRGAHGREVALQPVVVKLATTRAMESEAWSEVGIDLGLILACQL
jgi:hypothetical protein